jgi:hypothetical protein
VYLVGYYSDDQIEELEKGGKCGAFGGRREMHMGLCW